MKKTTWTLFAILASILILGGLMTYLPADPVASKEASSSLIKYINEDKNYSIEYPKDWQQQEMPRLDLVIISPPKDSSSQHATMNIVSETVGPSVSLEQFYNESVKHLSSELQQPQIESQGDQEINNLPAKWILYTHSMLQNEFRVLQYFIVTHGNIYLLTFSATKDDFDHFRPEFDKIISSFRYNEPQKK